MSEMIRDFIEVIQDDPRIRPSHVSLFVVIVNHIKNQQGNKPVIFFKKDMLAQAKVSAATFHRCIRELNSYGYVRYIPSFNAVAGSLISIPKLSS